MKQKNTNKNISEKVKNMLNIVLKVEANSSSCAYVFQPKVPKELKNFKK